MSDAGNYKRKTLSDADCRHFAPVISQRIYSDSNMITNLAKEAVRGDVSIQTRKQVDNRCSINQLTLALLFAKIKCLLEIKCMP